MIFKEKGLTLLGRILKAHLFCLSFSLIFLVTVFWRISARLIIHGGFLFRLRIFQVDWPYDLSTCLFYCCFITDFELSEQTPISIFDHMFIPSWAKFSGNECPSCPMLQNVFQHLTVFFISPLLFANDGIDMVKPSVSAAFSWLEVLSWRSYEYLITDSLPLVLILLFWGEQA